MKRLVESLNNAIEGFIYVLKTQRSMRIHFLSALFFIILGVFMGLDFFEMIMLCTIISLVLLAEMVNTAIELVIDLMKDTYHPLARMAKDVGAGAVLIAVVNAIAVGYLIFSKHIPFHVEDTLLRVKQSPWYVTLVILVAVTVLTVMSKAIFHRGTPLKGGMPSGLSATVFAIWAIISLVTGNAFITVLIFIMAFMVAKSRVSLGIHTAWEVAVGCILGVLTTVLVFQFFNL